jgi:succinylglutamate desuccinylase
MPWGLLAAYLLSAGCTRLNGSPAYERTEAPQDQGPPAPQAHVRAVKLGHSVQGRPLVMQVFGGGDEAVFILGGIHGSEPTSAAVARRLMHHLRDHPRVAAGRTIAILAEANADGLAARSRVNAHGVDLNRNFPARNWQRAGRDGRRHGPAAASEPETRAIMWAVEMLDPRCIVAIHAIRGRKQCNNYDGPAETLATLMNKFNHYPVRANIGYRTPGSFGSWAGVDRRIPTITLELPRGQSGEQCWEENRAALLALIQASPARFGK